jgi:hypothetical protein
MTSTQQIDKPLAEVTNPGGSLKVNCINGDDAIWYHQGNLDNIAFDVKISVAGSKPTDHQLQRYHGVVQAKKLGYSFRNMRHSRMLSVWILVAESGRVLLRKSFNEIAKGKINDNSQ